MIKNKPYKEIPLWKDGEWSTRVYDTHEAFTEYIESQFKEPGKYKFDETSEAFNEQKRLFRDQQDVYCLAPYKSRDYKIYWDFEKRKCREGVIFVGKQNEWYLPRDYYMWINFLPIYDKVKNHFDFPEVWDVQLHIALYELKAELHYNHASIFKKRQIASEQPEYQRLLTTKGWSTMGEIKPGDELWNPNGTKQRIIAKSNNGLSDVYKFTFSDGRTTLCGIEHNWEVYDKTTKKTKILNTRQLLELGIYQTPVRGKKKVYKNYRFAIDYCKPIPLLQTEVSVDPYVVGALLGDGHVNNRSIYISGQDQEIFDESKKGKNTKFIPECYKTSSIESRIALIQGLMDTDGYVNINGNDLHFTNTNKILIDDFTEVCRSLGLKVTIAEKTNKHGKFYRARLSGDIPFELFRLKRKLDRFKLRRSKRVFNRCAITSIEKEPFKAKSHCIIVDNPNHLYITNDYIVTHNSYFHAAKLTNQLWFEPGVTLKMGASESRYIDGDGTWIFFEEYKDFLNANTAWYRPMNPEKVKNWQQKIEVTNKGRKKTVGSKGRLLGMSFEQSATKGVGGPCRIFFYEEGGIAPTADQTFEFILPALKAGEITTGIFIIAGSVGKLKDCEPLKEFTMNPRANGIEPVATDLLDETGIIGESGLFIPEQWGMPPHIDEFGNSQPEKALEALDRTFAKWKKDLKPELYQLRISQHPRNIKEGFAYRDVSKFPLNLVGDQKRRIENNEFPYELIELTEDLDGDLVIKKTNKQPITKFPISPKEEDKTGTIVVWERPDPDTPWGTYYGSIDPVGEGKTITSESLCSIYIYKVAVEVTRMTEHGPENFIEGDKIVAAWCGRFDDLNETHERLRLIIEWYNAWTLVENNISLFIQYMIEKRKQKYLVPKNQVVFLKELGANKTVYSDYGWRNVGVIFKNHILNYLIEWLKEVIDHDTAKDGTITNRVYGIRRIPDHMAMLEMEAYRDGVNVDRLVSLGALIAFAKIQQANRGYIKRVENETKENLEKSPNLYKLESSPFRNIGKKRLPSGNYKKRTGFKHMK